VLPCRRTKVRSAWLSCILISQFLQKLLHSTTRSRQRTRKMLSCHVLLLAFLHQTFSGRWRALLSRQMITFASCPKAHCSSNLWLVRMPESIRARWKIHLDTTLSLISLLLMVMYSLSILQTYSSQRSCCHFLNARSCKPFLIYGPVK